VSYGARENHRAICFFFSLLEECHLASLYRVAMVSCLHIGLIQVFISWRFHRHVGASICGVLFFVTVFRACYFFI
jgi:hypothetical protein